MNPADVYRDLASPESDDIDVLKLLIGCSVKIFWEKPQSIILDHTLKYVVPNVERCFGTILKCIEDRFQYHGTDLEDFCQEFLFQNGPEFSPHEALCALKTFLPSLQTDIPPLKTVNQDAYYTTYFVLALNENFDVLRRWIRLGEV